MTQTTDAALVPEDVRALRVQNGALRTLNHCLEAEIEQHRARAQEYHAASQTLDSEREANRILTDTIEAQARRIEALEGAVATIIGRCESLEDEAADGLSKEMGDHAHGWYRGQKDAAKSLRRHLHDLTRPTP